MHTHMQPGMHIHTLARTHTHTRKKNREKMGEQKNNKIIMIIKENEWLERASV